MEEKTLTACGRQVHVSRFQSYDKLVTKRRVDNRSTMPHLTQSHRPSAVHRPTLLQGREHRAPGPARRRGRQVRPPGRRPAAVDVVSGRGRRIAGRRPAEVVSDDGDSLTGKGSNEPRTAAVRGESRQVAGGGGQCSKPRPLVARTAANGACRRRRWNSSSAAVIDDVIGGCSWTQSSDYNRTG